MEQLREYWFRSWADLGLRAPDEAVFEDILARYREPSRRYHTLEHLGEGFLWLDAAKGEANSYGGIGLALLFHDAIYDTKRNDNELQSAKLAGEILRRAEADGGLVRRVGEMIEAAAGHAASADADTELLLDIDLSILGAAPARYDDYARQIREEYSWVPAAEYAAARTRILEGFLDRPVLYRTDFFSSRLEARARSNLNREIENLKNW